jgi:glycosyltransferase involved in cell wall biosynthesis
VTENTETFFPDFFARRVTELSSPASHKFKYSGVSKHNMPDVTIIIPVHNREELIGRAIESVLCQTHLNFELIVVDDASTDGTVDVINAYDDDRVNCIALDNNQGANAARNAGIQHASGEYITFLDSDDEYKPIFIEKVIQDLAEAPDCVGGVYTSRRQVYQGQEVDIDLASQTLSDPEEMVYDYPAYGFSNWAFRANVFDQVGVLDESFPGLQDREFMIRYLEKYDFKPINEVLVTQHQHNGQMSPNKKLEALEKIYSKHTELFDETAQAYADYHRGWLYAKSGDIGKARNFFFQSLRKKPFTLKFQFQSIASLFGQTGFKHINSLKQRAMHVTRQYR